MNIGARQVFWSWTVLGCLFLGPALVASTMRSPWFRQPPKPIGDGMCYECVGFSLYSGGGFRENYADPRWLSLYDGKPEYASFINSVSQRDIPATGRPPLYPALIAVVYKALGRTSEAFMAIRVASAICLTLAGAMAAGLTASLIYRYTQSSLWSGLASLVTIGLAASQRTMQDYTTDFLTEPLALLLTQLAIVFFVRPAMQVDDLAVSPSNCAKCTKPENNVAWVVGCGIVIGLMILARSLFIVWLPGLLILLYLVTPGLHRQRFMQSLSVAAVAMLVCLPWWIHNCWALSAFMPLGTQGPVALAGGYCDEAYEDGGNWSFAAERRIRAAVASEDRFINASQIDQELEVVARAKQEVRSWIAAHSSQLPSLAWKRAVSHWNPYQGRALVWKLLIVAGLIWCAFKAGRSRWWLIGLPVLSTLVTMLLYETGGRFLVPLYGLLFTLAGLGACGVAIQIAKLIGWRQGQPS